MKTLILLLTLLVVGCARNEPDTIKWIEQAEKPVVARKHVFYGFLNEWDYTLMAADGSIYRTGAVSLSLPDTIKPHCKNKEHER